MKIKLSLEKVHQAVKLAKKAAAAAVGEEEKVEENAKMLFSTPTEMLKRVWLLLLGW